MATGCMLESDAVRYPNLEHLEWSNELHKWVVKLKNEEAPHYIGLGALSPFLEKEATHVANS